MSDNAKEALKSLYMLSSQSLLLITGLKALARLNREYYLYENLRITLHPDGFLMSESSS